MIIDCKCPKCGGDLVLNLRAFNAPPEGIDPFAAAAQIIREEADAAGVTVEQIKGTQRHRNIHAARKRAIIRAALETGLSSTRLARIFHRDHSTILHALRG